MGSEYTAGVVGLGSMGMGIAQSLLRAGIPTFGFDTAPARVSGFVADGGSSGALADCAATVDCLVIVVLNASQMENVLFGDTGVARLMRKGSVIIACPTVDPEVARRMEAACADLGLHYLDAPISGGAVKSAAGQLSIMASGSPDAFSRARPALDAMAETVFELGAEAGAGSAMKVINQLLAGTHIAAMAEAVTFGMTQGVDPATTVEVIGKCAGQSWMFDNRGPHVAAGDYTPHSAVDIWLKDLGIVLDVARQARFAAPLTSAALAQFTAASGSGLGGEDDAAVAKVYARNAGLTLPGDG